MKKIAIVLVVFLSLFGVKSYSYAASTENLLYKNIAITNMEIQKIYGEKKGNALIKSLDKYFIEIRYYKNKKKLYSLEKRIEPVLKKLEKKKYLTKKEKNIKSIAKNIYYRSKVLSKYLIK